MKRICRQHGISRWPSRKINKVNRSLSKLKRVIESVQGAEGAFSLNSLASRPLPVAVDSQPSSLNRYNPHTSPSLKLSEPQKNNESAPGRTLKNSEQSGLQDQLQGQRKSSPENLICDHSSSPQEVGKGSNRSKTRSGSCEDSAGTPTSHGSCQGSPPNESTPAKHLYISSINEQCDKVGGSPDLAYQPPGALNISPIYSIPDALLVTEPQETFGGMLLEDAGSSKDLRNLCPSVADAMLDEQVPAEFCWIDPSCPSIAPSQSMAALAHPMPHVTATKEMNSVTIKATFREDIIRFRLSLSSGILELKEEVAKRLKFEMGTFDIKYLDDDNEWVLIACDADLQECIDISRSSTASKIIRLLVQDVMADLGSSCESSRE
jgi:hypothetical protein